MDMARYSPPKRDERNPSVKPSDNFPRKFKQYAHALRHPDA